MRDLSRVKTDVQAGLRADVAKLAIAASKHKRAAIASACGSGEKQASYRVGVDVPFVAGFVSLEHIYIDRRVRAIGREELALEAPRGKVTKRPFIETPEPRQVLPDGMTIHDVHNEALVPSLLAAGAAAARQDCSPRTPLS